MLSRCTFRRHDASAIPCCYWRTLLFHVAVVVSLKARPSFLECTHTLDCCLAIAFVLVHSSSSSSQVVVCCSFLLVVPSPSADCCTLSSRRLLYPIPRSIVAPSLVLAYSYPLPRPIAVPSYPSTSHSYRCCTRCGRTVRSQAFDCCVAAASSSFDCRVAAGLLPSSSSFDCRVAARHPPRHLIVVLPCVLPLAYCVPLFSLGGLWYPLSFGVLQYRLSLGGLQYADFI